MATKVYELAKEMGIGSKEMLNKLNGMGIEVSSHMNVVSEKDCLAVRESMKKEKKNGQADEPKKAKDAGKASGERSAAQGQKAEGQKASEPRRERQENGSNARKAQGKPSQSSRSQGERKKSAESASGGGQKRSDGRAQGDQRQKSGQGQKGGQGQNKRTSSQSSQNSQSSRPPRQGEKKAVASSGAKDRKNDGRRQGAAAAANRGGGSRQGRDDRNSRDNRAKGAGNGAQNRSDADRRNGKDSRDGGRRNSSMAKPQHKHRKDHRKEQRREDARRAEEAAAAIPAGAVVVTVPITVKGLSEQIEISTSKIIMTLMRMGIMANINQNLDEDTVQILGDELNKQIIVGKVEEEEVEEGIENFTDREEDLKPRPPIITVMGHVDHGKTSLLDKIRNSSVTASESGGITQHIGASEITHNGQRIVFLDTPGHEAFTAMRARGAYVTDIAVLVVAADDSVKPQTVEAISHAKAASVPIIVAINKIDKPGANPEKVKQDLAENGILVEDWGGDVICVPVSAKTGEGLDSLLEMILLQAEMLELRANPSRLALGTVIEARLDKQKGPVATLLVLNGTLHAGMSVVAGNCSGRIKAMTNFKGDKLKKAGPATAVEILGLTDVPEAGDEFNAVSSDKVAREIAENRKQKQREQVMQKNAGVTLEQLFSQIEQGELKELNLIIKADVQGSVGALVTSLEKLKRDNVAVRILHTGVGTINESDVMLAGTTNAIIIGFNVRPSIAVTAMAQRDGVEIRTYSVIYEAIEEVEAALKGMLDPEFREEVLGTIEVRDTFKVPNVGVVAGGYVLEGKVERNAGVRLVRDGIVIHEGKISSLKRFKDDVREVNKGYECGIGIENYNDIKDGDMIEAYKMVEVERK